MRSLILFTVAFSCVIAAASSQDPAKPGQAGRARAGGPGAEERQVRLEGRTRLPRRLRRPRDPPALDEDIWERLELIGMPLSKALDVAVAYAQDDQKWEQALVSKAELVPAPSPYYEIELLTRRKKEGDVTVTRRWQLFVGKNQKVKRWLVRERFPGTPVRGELMELPSGILTYDIEEGDGALLEQDSKIRVHFQSATLIGLLVTDTRYNREPQEWDLATHPVRGLAEGLVGARVGGRRKLIVPPALAYGEMGRPAIGIPPNATMIFDIEILRTE